MVNKGDRVGFLMYNDFRVMKLLYGVTALGAIVVPLNTRFSVEENVFVLNDAGIKALYIHRDFKEQKQRWLPICISGEMITAVVMIEPGTGSDLVNVKTTAVRNGDEYILNRKKRLLPTASILI